MASNPDLLQLHPTIEVLHAIDDNASVRVAQDGLLAASFDRVDQELLIGVLRELSAHSEGLSRDALTKHCHSVRAQIDAVVERLIDFGWLATGSERPIPVINVSVKERARSQLLPEKVRDAVRTLSQTGVLVIADAFEPEMIAGLRGALEERQRPNRSAEEIGHRVGEGRYNMPIELSPPFDDPRLLWNHFCRDIIGRSLEEDCQLYSFGSVVARPGAALQHRHEDARLRYGPLSLGPFALQMLVPLDVGEGIGGTAFWPGSHRLEQPGQLADPPVEIDMQPGSCCIMDYRIHHRGFPNVSDIDRHLIWLLYTRRWYQDFDNAYQVPLRLARDRIAELPAEILPVLHRAYMEHYWYEAHQRKVRSWKMPPTFPGHPSAEGTQ